MGSHFRYSLDRILPAGTGSIGPARTTARVRCWLCVRTYRNCSRSAARVGENRCVGAEQSKQFSQQKRRGDTRGAGQGGMREDRHSRSRASAASVATPLIIGDIKIVCRRRAPRELFPDLGAVAGQARRVDATSAGGTIRCRCMRT